MDDITPEHIAIIATGIMAFIWMCVIIRVAVCF